MITASNKSAATEVEKGERFGFGANWKRFLDTLTDEKIAEAECSLQDFLQTKDLAGKRFLDIGSGSGLFSLAARNLGAQVHSFDYDQDSVACTSQLRSRFHGNDSGWTVEQGSALDRDYIKSLGRFDIVYSWGVLHHTGAMWAALENSTMLVEDRGKIFIAIYNDQRYGTWYWRFVKHTYNRVHMTRPFWICLHMLYPTLPSILLRLFQGRKLERGMSYWYDLLDWLGGYPFEVATPREIFSFFRARGFSLTALNTVGGSWGCNEFVFEKTAASTAEAPGQTP